MTNLPEFKPEHNADGLWFDLLRHDDVGKYVMENLEKEFGSYLGVFESQGEARPLVGSSAFAHFAVDSLVRPMGARVAGPKDLQRILDYGVGKMPEPGVYDAGVVFAFSNCNHQMALDIHENLEATSESIRRLKCYPAILSEGLKVVLYGHHLALEIREDADYNQVVPVPVLGCRGDRFEKSDPGLRTGGIPSKVGEGQRMLYIPLPVGKPRSPELLENLGITRLYLDANLDLHADHDDLAYNSPIGRTILVGI
jgi:hypothetical protein